MSLDFRLMFAYHGCMMVLFMIGGSLSVRQEALFTSLLVVILVVTSLRHRRTSHWRWPGIKLSNLFFVLWTVALVSFFLYAATPLFPPNQPQALPWYLAGLGIGTFGVLSGLRIVYASETEFIAQCRTIDQYGREIQPPMQEEPVQLGESGWKAQAKRAFTVAFLLVWASFVASFYFFGVAFRDGSPVPTPTKTQPLEDHGKTVYVSRAEKQRIDTLQMVAWVGLPIVMLSGLALHFIFRVKIFGDTTSLRGPRLGSGKGAGASP